MMNSTKAWEINILGSIVISQCTYYFISGSNFIVYFIGSYIRYLLFDSNDLSVVLFESFSHFWCFLLLDLKYTIFSRSFIIIIIPKTNDIP